GYIDISLSSTSQGNDVGLYPFNSTSIERLYQSLVDTVSRTPRSLLNDVISYILQSHSEKIEGGEFPPSDKVLAPKIKTLEFDPPEHRRIIEQQGGQDVERLITLLLFWGNRSAFQADQNGENYVGGISPSVFNAFSLPTIQGRSDSVTEIVVQVPESVDEITDDGQDRDVSSLDEKTKNEHLKDITAWADGGRLYRHSDFLRWMGQLFIHFIDWQHHGIAPSLVPSSNKASSIFAIEDQSAQIMGHRLVFDRSSKLRYALIALAQLNNTDVSLTPEQYSEYITALNIWIETEENRIVAFIQDHTETQDLHNDTLSQILLENAVILACLSGNLSADMSFYDLYKTIIQTCNGKENFLKNQWQMSMNRLNQHSSWINLMRKIQTDVGIVREETLQQFNSVQGDSTEIQFLKAANLISLLKEFETNNWEINDLENLPKSGSGLDRWWESALRIREVLKKDFQTVITTTYNEINNSFNDLNNILGDNDPSDIIENIQGLLQNLQSKSPIDLRFQSGLHTIEVDNLRLIKNEIMQLKGYESNIKISKYLSKRANYLFALITPYLQYFKDLVRAIENKRTELQNSNSGSLKIQVDGQLNKTEQKYIQVLQAIDQSLQEE
ncbi:MAG: hypothetical protein H8D23_09530, partial [Candidatus Brocadiales bacterium]|nr:hypothetical protein [Candidatus Brocadiales bacterium]